MKRISSKQLKIVILALAIASIGTVTGIMVLGAQDKGDITVRLREYKASIGDITVGVDASAMISYKQTEHFFEAGGKIGELFVEPGDMVKKGDQLAEISEESLKEQLEKLTIEHQKASIRLAGAKDDHRLGMMAAENKLDESMLQEEESQLTFEEAELSVDEAQNNLSRARKRVKQLKDELEELEDNDDTSEESEASIKALKDQLYTARQEAERAALLLERAKLAYEKLELKQNRKSNDNYAQEEYDITLRKLANTYKLAELDLYQINLDINKVREAQKNRMLVADQDGIVISTGYVKGEEIGSKAVITVGDSQTIQAVAMVEQSDIGKLKPDQTVEMRLEAYPDDLLPGTIKEILYLPEKNGNSVFYKVFFDLDVTDIPIHEGMTGDVTFIIKKKASVLKLSNKAIIFRDGKQYVLLQNEDGTTYETEITTGFSDGRFSEVRSGLSDGQTVVVKDKSI